VSRKPGAVHAEINSSLSSQLSPVIFLKKLKIPIVFYDHYDMLDLPDKTDRNIAIF